MSSSEVILVPYDDIFKIPLYKSSIFIVEEPAAASLILVLPRDVRDVDSFTTSSTSE